MLNLLTKTVSLHYTAIGIFKKGTQKYPWNFVDDRSTCVRKTYGCKMKESLSYRNCIILYKSAKVRIQHYMLRWMLYRDNRMPWNYTSFLDHCVDRIFLRRVVGGYIFIHRLLMEHFSGLTDEDIKRIATDLEARR